MLASPQGAHQLQAEEFRSKSILEGATLGYRIYARRQVFYVCTTFGGDTCLIKNRPSAFYNSL
jgi:hypothetical protein